MRHGRKSRTKQFNGYKRHIAIADGLILATAIEPANAPEHTPTARLLHAVGRHGQVRELDIDRGYLPSSTVEQMHRDGVKIHSRTYVKSNEGRFTKYEFKIDLRRQLVTCPNSKTAPITPSGYVKFDVSDCSRCKLKPSCTTGPSRTIKIHRAEDLLIKLRRENSTAEGRAVLRERVAVDSRVSAPSRATRPAIRAFARTSSTSTGSRLWITSSKWLGSAPLSGSAL
jgi:Transposase DDE domain